MTPGDKAEVQIERFQLATAETIGRIRTKYGYTDFARAHIFMAREIRNNLISNVIMRLRSQKADTSHMR